MIGLALLALFYAGALGSSQRDLAWFVPLTLLQGALFVAGAAIAFRSQARRSSALIVVTFAVLFRAVAVVAVPFASTDIYRYVWDGRVISAGINPYSYRPADPHLRALRDASVYPNINRKATARTIYPPVAEGVFYLATRFGGVTAMKVTMTCFDIAAGLLLMRLLYLSGIPVQRILLYAWHPLIVWEFAGNGHVDAIAVAFIAAAVLAYRYDRALLVGAALAAATLVKFLPALLLAPLYRRWDWKAPFAFVAVAASLYIPFLSAGARVAGYLPGYAREEGIDSGERFYLLNIFHTILHIDVPPLLYIAGSVLVLGLLWVAAVRTDSKQTHLREAFLLTIATAVTVFLSPAYPWYFAWLVPLCVLFNSRAVLYLTLVCPILYVRELFDSAPLILVLDTVLFVPAIVLAVRSIVRHRGSVLQILEAHV
ncbi:MAG: glycosyltransferase 87 family protein [Candidatus Eremiobacteraeota bacterium]|nr:glycosyltransferase 87 family protein [Candidatus Eremiobacteraeota bacterium]